MGFFRRLSFGLFGLVSLMSISFGIVVASPVKVHASAATCTKSILGFPSWFQYLELNAECEIVGPNDASGDLDWTRASGYVAIAVVEIMLRLASLVAVGYVVYGGFKFITSQGEAESAKDARNTIINALIGLVITMIAATVINFVTTRLTS